MGVVELHSSLLVTCVAYNPWPMPCNCMSLSGFYAEQSVAIADLWGWKDESM